MTPTRPRNLLAVGLVVAVLANLVVRLTYGSLPGFPLLGGITLAVLGVAEAIGGRALRARIRREPGTTPVQPLVAARAVLVAKASSVAGAVVGGAWLGLLVFTAPQAGSIQAAAGGHRGGGRRAGLRAGARRRGAVAGALLSNAGRSRTPRRVGSGAMTQATGVFLTGGPTAALPTQQRQRRGVLAPVIGLVALGICGLVVLGLVGTSVGLGGIVVGALCALLPGRPGGGRVPVDRPLGARAAAPAAHRVPVGRLLLRARRADHQLQRGAGRRRAARPGQRRRHRLHRDRPDRRGGPEGRVPRRPAAVPPPRVRRHHRRHRLRRDRGGGLRVHREHPLLRPRVRRRGGRWAAACCSR